MDIDCAFLNNFVFFTWMIVSSVKTTAYTDFSARDCQSLHQIKRDSLSWILSLPNVSFYKIKFKKILKTATESVKIQRSKFYRQSLIKIT